MRTKLTLALLSATFLLLAVGITQAQAAQTLLPGTSIPKFVDALPVAGDITVVNATGGTLLGMPSTPAYTIHMREFEAQILPSTGVPLAVPPIPAGTASWVWGYLTDADKAAGGVRPSYLGPVVVAERNIHAYPTYLNELPMNGYVQTNILPIDQTLDWANPLGLTGPLGCLPDALGAFQLPLCGAWPYVGPIPDSVHIHGGEVPPKADGGPDSWFTQNNVITGPGFPGNTLDYPNGQQESTIWFHPHGFGITRLNVFAGMAGIYPIMDSTNNGKNKPLVSMPAFPQYDIPLIIQDRSFDTTGQLFYNLAANPQPNPTVHPFWIPEFIGDAIVVNGKTWPYLNVEPRQYRFRILNGSNARTYNLFMNKGLKFTVIATDDGYLQNAVTTSALLIAPGERYEVIVDFSGIKKGQAVMYNDARCPYPGGVAVTKNGTDTIMQFRVNVPLNGTDIPAIVNGTALRDATNPIVPINNGFDTANGITRQLTLNEVLSPTGPLELVMNNSKYNLPTNLPGCPQGATSCRETEMPAVGDTEIWEIINTTADMHPVHTHLVSFQILDRTPYQSATWINQYQALLVANGVVPGGGPPNQYNVKNADGAIGGNPPINAFLQMGKRRLPMPYEMGWKDTVVAMPGEVTRIVVRWAPTDVAVGGVSVGQNLYPFDPTMLNGGIGYVWHCHILDHEDNEMMRSYVVGASRQLVCSTPTSCP